MQPRDEQILKHVALYRISIRAVIERLFFEEKSCDDVISRLVNDEKCLTVGKLPNRVSYYSLSLMAARKRGVQENRARSQGVQARSLRRSLAVLWFCCMSGTVRHRVERNILTKLFLDADGLGVPHCWEPIDDKRRLIHRIYTPGPNTPSDDILRTLRKDAERAIADAKLAPYVLANFYAFAVLVEHSKRKEQIEAILGKGSPLPVSVKVEVTPGVHELAEAIRAHKEKRGLSDDIRRQPEAKIRV